jgi:DNA-binding CsgD family transcriptional regulator
VRGPSEPATGDADGRDALLARARAEYRSGEVSIAWDTCAQVAALSRKADDPAGLADAATLIRTTGNPTVARRVHALCVEALARLGGSDPVREARVRAQLTATADPFLAEDGGPEEPPEGGDAEAAFLNLQARHAELLGVAHLTERLALARSAIDLGRRTGVEEYACWGRRWRLDVYVVLGNRVDLTSELAALAPLVERLDRPAWRSWLLMVEASQRLWEGRFADALALNEEAARVGGPESEARHFRLMTDSAVAELTGVGIEAVEAEVRTAVDALPYLARGWLCRVLKVSGKRDEAATLWRSVAPHAHRLPERAAEWLIATAGNAETSVWLGDLDTARSLYHRLLPYADLQAATYAHTPYHGPVALTLGRLAVLLGDPAQGRRHLVQALASCEELHALPHLALTHAELAALDGGTTRPGRTHAETALQLAHRLGLQPLVAELTALLATPTHADRRLTRRELEIVGLVAAGLSNAAIGRRLTLSERTVENHVSHVLRKLGCTSRAAVATWYATEGPARPTRA